ncbi:MAG TPA: DNA-binding protein [Firmicutes bacterium]|nr:DNA-binding protein [Bacillota bacterium]
MYKAAKGAVEQVYLLRLMPGTDLVKGVEEFAQQNGITHAVLVSLIGTLDQGAFRNPRVDTTLPIIREYEGADQIDTVAFERPVEIVGGSGNILPKGDSVEAHIHLIVSQDGARTMGGHLFRGRIWTQAEIVLVALTGLDGVTRDFEKETGLWQIQIP